MSDHKDYSGTPLWRKLGIKEGARVLCTRAPEGFADELQRLARLPDGVEFLRRPGRDVHVAITFVTRRSDLAARFPSLARSLPRRALDRRRTPRLVLPGLTPCAALTIRVGPNADAGWSSPVARRAHNPKVAGSNPAPATKFAWPHR